MQANSAYLAGVVKFIGIDVETEDPLLKVSGPSWLWNQGSILCTSLSHMATGKVEVLNGDGGVKVQKLLSDPKVALVGVNLAYDLGWLCWAHGLKMAEVKASIVDVAVVESMIDLYQKFSLDELAYKYLNERKGAKELISLCDRLGLKGDFRKHLATLWKQEKYRQMIRDYVASDADQPCRIWDHQRAIIDKNNQWPAFDMNMQSLFITIEMRQHGIRIDYEKWKSNSATAGAVEKKLSESFYKKYGYVNINSPKQLAELFDDKEVPYKYKVRVKGYTPVGRKFTSADCFSGDDVRTQKNKVKEILPSVVIEKGQVNVYLEKRYVGRATKELESRGYTITANPSVNKFTFADTRATHQVSADIVEFKQVKNIVQKFLGPKFERFLVHYPDGTTRLHGSFDPVGARQTGRISSKTPNLQNIPSKTILFAGTDHQVNLARMCREVFIPDEGRMFVKLDYSGQENVLQAHFAVGANGEYIRKMYLDNPRLDEHSYVTKVSGLGDQYGASVGRKYAKNLRFGKSYGMQLPSIIKQFGWSPELAKEIEFLVQSASPWVYETMQYLQEMLKGEGSFIGRSRPFIKTLAGRIIFLRFKNDAYKFYNYLIQGSASDMIKLALIKIRQTQTVDRLLLTVHDENCLDVPISEEGFKRVAELKLCMETASNLSIPIICDPEIGSDWAHVEGQVKDDNGYPVESVEEMCARIIEQGFVNERAIDDEVLMAALDDEEDTADEDSE